MVISNNDYVELLKSVQDKNNVEISPMMLDPETEPKFIIDLNSREITVPEEFKFLGLLNDTSAETIYFEMARYFDGIDISQYTIVVQFLAKQKDEMLIEGVYPVTEIDIETDPTKIIFGWKITNEVTSFAADISFSVRVYEISTVDSDYGSQSIFSYCLNTLPAILPVKDTLNVTNNISVNYPSYFDEWNRRMQELNETATKTLNEADKKLQETIAAADRAELAAIKQPIISEKSTWMIWNPATQQYEDTGEITYGQLPTIGENGNWFVDDYDTGKPSRGEQGPQGPRGDGINILGTYASEEELRQEHPTGSDGDAYLINRDIWIWTDNDWKNGGQIQGPQGIQGEKGEDGKDGANGTDGYTPVRGKDYWTREDQEAIIEDMRTYLFNTINEHNESKEAHKYILDLISNTTGACTLKITFSSEFSGQAYTVTREDGLETYNRIVPVNLVDTIILRKCNALYTVKSTTKGDLVEYSNDIRTGSYYGEYQTFLNAFYAILHIKTVSDVMVYASTDGAEYSGMTGIEGTLDLRVGKPGQYTIKGEYSNVNSEEKSISATETGRTYEVDLNFITLVVTSENESEIQVEKGDHVLIDTIHSEDDYGVALFYLPEIGEWTVTATKGEETETGKINISEYIGYSITLNYTKIFGVMWDMKNQSSALTRLTPDNDPTGCVNTTISSEPIPAVGTGEGSSPFDKFYPWNEMEEYNIVDQVPVYKKGDPGFTRTGNDTVVYIPEFYYKIVEINNSMMYYVSNKPYPFFELHPGSGKYIGKYDNVIGYYSKSGLAPINTNETLTNARTNIKNKGEKWGVLDYMTWSAVCILYLVEFADWNCQSKIGKGNVSSSLKNTGGTDTMTYHTGMAEGTNGQIQVQYRWIEDLWGNIWEWLDGITIYSYYPYICTDPSKYVTDKTNGDYKRIEVQFSSNSGFIKEMKSEKDHMFMFIPTLNGGSASTYICDYVNYSSGAESLRFSGQYNNNDNCGLFCLSYEYPGTSSPSGTGSRLLFYPKLGEEE